MSLQSYKKEYDSLSIKCNLSGKDALQAVKLNGFDLRYVKEQTPEICLEAVKKNGYALRYVKEQTPEICLEAVKLNGYALQYVNADMFSDSIEEMTLEEVCKELGREVKIVK